MTAHSSDPVASDDSTPRAVTVLPLPGLPIVSAGDDLTNLILVALRGSEWSLRTGDVVVVAQKVVSKAEGRVVDLRTVTPSDRAASLAQIVGKDPALVEVVLQESRSIVRAVPGVLIVETRHGFVCANAGVDHSNVSTNPHEVLLLPLDPDASARRLRCGLELATGERLACVVIDSHGRPWREGTVGVAIGCDGISAVRDLRGRHDLFGRKMLSTTEGVADELAAAASLVMGQCDEGVPVAIVRGYKYEEAGDGARAIQRAPSRDLFR